MKKTTLAMLVATLGLGATSAMAQTQNNVTLYGVIDTSIRYTSNTSGDDKTPASNSSRIGLDSGAFNGSRFGLKGSEDLGGGLKAIFKIEAGFSPDTGEGRSALFNRASYLGAEADWGRVTFGRQDTVMFEHLATFDPFEVSNYDETSFHAIYADGLSEYDKDPTRRSNSIAYHGEFGANKEWSLAAMYGLGEQSSSTSDNTHLGISGGYKFNNFNIGVSYMRANGIKNLDITTTPPTYDNFRQKKDVFAIAGSYVYDKWLTFSLGYLNNRETDEEVISSKRKNDVFYGGVVANVDNWILRGGVWTDRLKARNDVVDSNGVIVAGGDTGNERGRHYAYAVSAEYRLSKRTGVYATVDYSRASDALYEEGRLGLDPEDKKATSRSRTGFGVGIRHFF